MYKNVGNSIKALAKVCAIIGIILSIIVGLLLVFVGIQRGEILYIVIGVLEGILLAFGAWIAQLCLYGYGELIDANDRTNEKLDTLISIISKKD